MHGGSVTSTNELEFLGHNGFALQISKMICKNLKGDLKITNDMGIHSQKFVTYSATFAATKVSKPVPKLDNSSSMTSMSQKFNSHSNENVASKSNVSRGSNHSSGRYMGM